MDFTKEKLVKSSGCKGCSKDCQFNTTISAHTKNSKRTFGCNSANDKVDSTA